jgi:tetratricopeptide (TPR) repeat protein
MTHVRAHKRSVALWGSGLAVRGSRMLVRWATVGVLVSPPFASASADSIGSHARFLAVPRVAPWILTASAALIESRWSQLPPPPSLLRPGLLDPWASDRREAAERTLADWVKLIQEASTAREGVDAGVPAPVDPETQAKAIRLYVQARAAALEGRSLIAAQKFEEALFLDPDSPDILSAYARLLGRMGNGAKANDLYQRLLVSDPSRPEALMTTGLQAANRGDADGTIAALGRLLARPETLTDDERSDREEFWSSMRPDAILASELSLVRALNERGADAALLEVLEGAYQRAIDVNEPQLAGPPAVECRRLSGDARARRGDVVGALADWRVGLELVEAIPAGAGDDRPAQPSRSPDPALPALVARILWAEVATNGPAVTTLRRLVDTTGPREEWIALASWLASTTSSSSTASGVNSDAERRAFASTVEVRVGDPRSARFAAALVPARAFERLAASHDRRRPDRAHVAAWFRAAAELAPQRAVDLATTLLEDCAHDAEVVVDGLLACGLDAVSLIEQVAPAAGTEPHPRRIALLMRVLTAYGQTREAWAIGMAWRGEPDETAQAAGGGRRLNGGARKSDPAVLRALIAVALAAQRTEAIPTLAASVADDDVAGQIELVRAWGFVGDTAKARSAAERAVSAASADRRAADGGHDRRTSAIARTLLSAALAADAARDRDRQGVTESLGELRTAVGEDPSYEPAWAQLLNVTRVLGRPSERGGASDRADSQRGASPEELGIRRELVEAIPESTTAFTLEREELMARGRSADALEALLARAASALWDESLLKDAVSALSVTGRSDEALALLDDRLAHAPGLPIAWQLWTEVTIASGGAEEALDRLSARIEQPTPDPIAQSLLAQPLRALGRHAEADAADEAQLERQVPSVRREIARIARLIDTPNDAPSRAKAGEALAALAKKADELASPECFAGLELALRLPSDSPLSGQLGSGQLGSGQLGSGQLATDVILAFANVLLDRAKDGTDLSGMEPAVVVRAAGAVALVRRDPAEAEERSRMANRAVAAIGGMKSPLEGSTAIVWLDTAQRFADARAFAAGSDFLGALAKSEVLMTPEVAARIATACFALDAAAGGRAANSMALLDLVRSRGVRPFAGRDRSVERDSDELYLLAGLYTLVGDRDGSNEILRASLTRDPNHAMTLNNLGWDILERQGATPEAESLIERAHAANPTDAAILDSLGWLRYKQERFEEARELLAKAIAASEGEPSAEVLDHFGDAAIRTGQREKAIEAWREVDRLVRESSSRELIVDRIPIYEMNEHGVRVIDAEKLWYRNYGIVAERAAAKLKEAEGTQDRATGG